MTGAPRSQFLSGSPTLLNTNAKHHSCSENGGPRFEMRASFKQCDVSCVVRLHHTYAVPGAMDVLAPQLEVARVHSPDHSIHSLSHDMVNAVQ